LRPKVATKGGIHKNMSDTQYRIQAGVFAPEKYENMTHEEAIEDLKLAGILNEDGTLNEEYWFLRPEAV